MTKQPAAVDLPPISEQIWEQKYRLRSADGAPVDATLDDTWARVARAAASVEKPAGRSEWEARFAQAMRDLQFLPAGRIIAGAGSGRDVTLFNCFVMGRIEDDLGSIFDNLKEAALTMQRGGGIGHDFSTLRPAGALVASVGAGASGPVSFMEVWDAMCRTIMSAGQRRGAMMGTLRCDHPDIEAFIDAKATAGRLSNFNLSVLVTDAFMEAVAADASWRLQFAGRTVRSVSARSLWQRIMRATYDHAEPGVIFIDRINAQNNLAYCEAIQATNPCGEQPLPPHGACLLGSINLARLVPAPFTASAGLDEVRLAELAGLATRFLDNVIDVSAYPLEAQRQEALAKRRIGLGITGLGDALAMLGVHYDSAEARRLAGRWMALIQRHAYLASASLAAEKGPFPRYEAAPFLSAPGVARLDPDVRELISQHGMRNGCLTSIAPTGTISLLAGNVSSGVEPIFDLEYRRRFRDGGDRVGEETIEDYAYRLFRTVSGEAAPLPAAFVTAQSLSPDAHLAMQAALQPHVDSAISKTINCPEGITFEAFENVYAQAYALGLKGCTTFRPNPVTGSVLTAGAPSPTVDHTGDGAAPVGAAPGTHPPGTSSPAYSTAPDADRSGIVYMSRPLEREPILAGYTYKLKWAGSDHAIYVTINDIERDGRRRPFEIFINTKNLEHYAWTVALTRMISAVFRRGGDVSFVVEELKAVFDPQGGQWMDGRYVPSLLAAIGGVIEHHLVRIGFLHAPQPLSWAGDRSPSSIGEAITDGMSLAGEASVGASPSAAPASPVARSGRVRGAARICPKCGVGSLVLQSGCYVCRDCGYSKCS